MNDDRPIKVHVDEPMREHMAFVLRRYLHDSERALEVARRMRPAVSSAGIEFWVEELRKTRVCLDELNEAGT